MFHWGLHPWAIYGIVALSLALFCYNKGLPLTIRSMLHPIFGERTWGWPGHIIDILAVMTGCDRALAEELRRQRAIFGVGDSVDRDSGPLRFAASESR